MDKKYVLGLDIGIASVGWGIVDYNDMTVVDAGVRLFEEGTKDGNVTRRLERGARRLRRRRKHRVFRIKKLFLNEGLIDEIVYNQELNPYEIRRKGLNNKLTNQELFIAITHIAKRRGSSGFDVIEDNVAKQDENASTKSVLSSNKKLLAEDKFICEVQIEKFDTHGVIRNENNNYELQDYIKEVNKILSNQDLEDEINNKIIEIIKSKREYFEGPGSIKSPTKYGRYFMENDELQYVDLIEKMRGKCTYFPEEKRASKHSYTAYLFNLYNDLNNIWVSDNDKKDLNKSQRKKLTDKFKLTKEQKEEFIKTYAHKMTETGGIKNLATYLGVDDNQIMGCKVNVKGKNIITEFKVLRKIDKLLKETNFDIFKDIKLTNDIIDILSIKKGISERKEELIKLKLDEQVITILANTSGVSEYHSLSYKALNIALDEMKYSSKNSMEVFSMPEVKVIEGFRSRDKELKGMKFIPFDEAAILSPVAKKSQKQTLNIVNQLIKKYGNFDSIIIETAREKNSDDKKKIVRDGQKKKLEDIEKAHKLIEESKSVVKKLNYALRRKLRLYIEQDCKCIYSLKPINLEQLINDRFAYEDDHIIPRSISFTDSYNNRVLCYPHENQAKGNMTPYQYFKSGNASISYEEYKSNILSNKKISKNKRENLLNESDLSKYENNGFINRNLVDTRYASRVILNTLQDYFKVNDIPTKVHTIRGQLTSLFRSKAGLVKIRDEDHKHHAIDALIVAGIKSFNLFNEILSNRQLLNNSFNISNEDFIDSKYLKFLKELVDYNKFKYSHQVDKKANRQLTNQTIYSVKQYENTNYLIEKYKDIYNADGERLTKLLDKGKEDSLLVYINDRKTYEKIKKVYDEYKEIDPKNPFLEYYKDHGHITKYSKKDNGPKIKSLKFKAKKLGTHENISHKYGNTTGNPSVVLMNVNWYRIDIFYKLNKNNQKEYKFLKVDYKHIEDNNKIIKLNKQGKDYYEEEKVRRKITSEYLFDFTLFKGNYFKFLKDGKLEIVKLSGLNYNTSSLEYKLIHRNKRTKESIAEHGFAEDKRLVLTVGKKVTLLEKVNSDILGLTVLDKYKK